MGPDSLTHARDRVGDGGDDGRPRRTGGHCARRRGRHLCPGLVGLVCSSLARRRTRVRRLAAHAGAYAMLTTTSAPAWAVGARGPTSVVVGLSQYTDRRHLVRAALDGVCLQTKDVRTLARRPLFPPHRRSTGDGGGGGAGERRTVAPLACISRSGDAPDGRAATHARVLVG